MNYEDFLKQKDYVLESSGFNIDKDKLNPMLFDFQKDVVRWALAKGRACIFAECGLGKGQPYGSKVLTPYGWKEIQNLKVGDEVISSDGKAHNVKGVYPKQELPTWRFFYSDGTECVFDKDHLHIVRTPNDKYRKNGQFRVMSTTEILEKNNLHYGKHNSRTYEIPIVKPVEYKISSTPYIDPYVIGCLLGDDHLSGNIGFTNADEDILSMFKNRLNDGVTLEKKHYHDYDYIIKTGLTGKKKHPFRKYLEDVDLLNVKSKDKFIPNDYLYGSVSNRIDLLRGLMDTDGYISKDSLCQYYTISEKLKDDMIQLVQSLGGIAKVSEKQGKYKKDGIVIECNKVYSITIRIPKINPFYCKRKAEKWKDSTNQFGRWIDDIKFEKNQKTVCISVGSEDSSYVTENYIVTHNTAMQLSWAHQVHLHTGGKVLILAPLSVADQTKREAEKFHYNAKICEKQEDCIDGINITNYEKLDKFVANEFVGVVLDESSILKSYTGKVRTSIIENFQNVPYKLACTATPAPNDYMELGNHSEFCGVMTRSEMLSMFFVHDGGQTSKWRLKGHAKDVFWQWMASWSVFIDNPSNLGYDGTDYELPNLNIHEIIVDGNEPITESLTLTERRNARKDTLELRCQKAAELVNNSDEQWLVWCDLNAEGDRLNELIEESKNVQGSDKNKYKSETMLSFSDEKLKCLISKPQLAGYGMNWQNCHNVIFTGLSDSFEQYYQAVRRCWRFGQTQEVNVYIIISAKEGCVKENIERKQLDFITMRDAMINLTKEITKKELKSTCRLTTPYEANTTMKLPNWEEFK